MPCMHVLVNVNLFAVLFTRVDPGFYCRGVGVGRHYHFELTSKIKSNKVLLGEEGGQNAYLQAYSKQ